MVQIKDNIPINEIIISCSCWSVIILYYLVQLRQGVYSKVLSKENKYHPVVFFAHMRQGWVIQNHLTGQAAANTTRDYLRILLFFCGNAILVATILFGFATSTMSRSRSLERNILLGKLAANILIFLIIFFLFLMSTRYAMHFQ
jgi:hypothetical protein